MSHQKPTPTSEEIEYMTIRGLWDDYQQKWTPTQQALYLGQLRDNHGQPLSARDRALGIDLKKAKLELEGLFGVLLWDRSKPDPVPIHRD